MKVTVYNIGLTKQDGFTVQQTFTVDPSRRTLFWPEGSKVAFAFEPDEEKDTQCTP
jgi:hypothetical protein